MKDESKRNNLGGNPNWKKGGPSPNPGGQAKKTEAMKLAQKAAREFAAKVSPEMLEILVAIARDEEAADRDRIQAAMRVVEWGIGKPATVDMNGEVVTDTNIEVVIPRLDDIEYNPEPH